MSVITRMSMWIKQTAHKLLEKKRRTYWIKCKGFVTSVDSNSLDAIHILQNENARQESLPLSKHYVAWIEFEYIFNFAFFTTAHTLQVASPFHQFKAKRKWKKRKVESRYTKHKRLKIQPPWNKKMDLLHLFISLAEFNFIAFSSFVLLRTNFNKTWNWKKSKWGLMLEMSSS